MGGEELIHAYGYIAVLVGTLLEGETVLALAGYAAQRGWLDLRLVLCTAFLGALAGDQLFFAVGRRYGQSLLGRFPRLAQRTARARSLLERYHAPFIVTNRFMIGLRVAGPLAVGLSAISWRRFLAFNAAGALLWTLAIGVAGFLFGHAVEGALGHLRYYELAGAAALAAAGSLTWVLRLWRHRSVRRDREA